MLEARDRVGGRCWNRPAGDGTVLSVGGTWLGVGHDRMFQLCAETGLETYEQYDDGDTVLRLKGKNRRYRGLIPSVNPVALASLGIAIKRLDRLVTRVPAEEPWTARRAHRLDSRTLGDWIESRFNVPSDSARSLLRTTMTLLFCTDPSEVSLLGALVLARGGGSFDYYTDTKQTETHLVTNGVPELANRLAAALGDAIHLSAPVRTVSQTADRAQVEADSVTVGARQVIVATPPVLASRIAYDPPLPPDHSHLLSRLVPGSIIRFLTVYDEAFWRSDGLSGQSVDPDSPIPVGIDQSPEGGSPGVLSSYAISAGALALARLDPKERREVCTRALAERYGAAALNPIAYSETDWSSERWSGGGMIGHFAPGVLTSYGRALRTPVGRIHWASSEQATEMHGLMEGAVRSGELAADAALAAV